MSLNCPNFIMECDIIINNSMKQNPLSEADIRSDDQQICKQLFF